MQYSEQPIFRPDQDVLGRAPFALELANAIDRLTVAKDGFVMAVLGEWGSGKTSVIELTLRFLRHIEMERASHRALLGDDSAQPKTLDQIEEMGRAFDLIEGQFQSYGDLNRDVTMAQRGYRSGLIRSWSPSKASAENAEHYWRLKLRVDSEPRTIVVRFSPWLIGAHAELARALLSDLAREL